MLDGQSLGRIDRRATGCGLGLGYPPQNRVHERCRTSATGLPRKIDAGIHRRMIRHAIEVRQLVRTEPENVLKLRVDAGPATRKQRRNAGVQQASLPQHPGSHFVSQTTVGFGQSPDATVERHLECVAAANLRENLEGSPSGTKAGCLGRSRRFHQRGTATPAFQRRV